MSIQESDDLGTDHDEELVDLPPYVAGLVAETEADHENHGRARVALINRLMEDPDIVALYDRWVEETQLGQAARKVEVCWDRFGQVATMMGFASWSEVEAHTDPDGMITTNVEIEDGNAIQRKLDETIDECNLVADELDAALAACPDEFDRLFAEGIAFLRSRPRTWPWMVYELVSQWTSRVIQVVSQTRRTHRYWIASPGELPAAKFETQPGEPLADAVARLISETMAERPTLPPGRRAAPAVIDRYVEWWYRRYMRGESINRIASDVAAERQLEGDARKQVRYGISRAEHWLAVASWEWRDDEDDASALAGK